MVLNRNGIPVSTYESEYVGKKIVIGIDASKSNTAIVIGDVNGEVYNDYEINGSGSDNDAWDVSYVTRKALRTLLKGSEILLVEIEDIITKKADNVYNQGMSIHKSRAAITHIFDSFIIFFMDEFGIKPEPANNQAWKAAILPEEFRRRYHKKGAKDYYDMYYPGSRWAGRKDDVTDAYCIYQYGLRRHKFNVSYSLSNVGKTSNQIDSGFFSIDIIKKLPANARKFDYNDSFSLDQIKNALAANIVGVDCFAYIVIPIEKLNIKDIYENSLQSKFERNTKEIVLVATNVVVGR